MQRQFFAPRTTRSALFLGVGLVGALVVSFRFDASSRTDATAPSTTSGHTIDHAVHHGDLTLEGARLVMDAALAEAERLAAPGGTIAIVDSGGHLVLLERPTGTVPATPPIASGKARTAALFGKPTKHFEDIVNGGRTVMLAIEGWTPMQGGIPIVVDGEIVGGIGVSGAATAAQDEEIALIGAKIAETFGGAESK